jgi:hypothetical protein
MSVNEKERIKKLENEIIKIKIYGLILVGVIFILFIDFIRLSIFGS